MKTCFLVITVLFFAGCNDGVKRVVLDSSSSSSDNEVTDTDSVTEKTDNLTTDNSNINDSENITDSENMPDSEDSPDNGNIPNTDNSEQNDDQNVEDDVIPDNNQINDNEDTPDIDNVTNHYPASCAEVLTYDSDASDGEYTLYVQNSSEKPWTAYCADMDSTPADYLVLAKTGDGYNFSGYAVGGESSGTDVTTLYTRIKIDPSTFTVTTGDQRFSTSSGQASQGSSTITSMPYGTASDCQQGTTPHGTANIDLTGTPFTVNDTFCTGGYTPNGEAVFSTGNKIVNITGGGYCGWTTPCPTVYNPYNTNGSELELSYSSGD